MNVPLFWKELSWAMDLGSIWSGCGWVAGSEPMLSKNEEGKMVILIAYPLRGMTGNKAVQSRRRKAYACIGA
eukprot:scaffold315991_cov18-Tisochrysis_lutea.AAC.1